MSANPPWADKIIKKYHYQIDARLKQDGHPRSWFPRMSGEGVEKELGCGHYGCIFPVTASNVVCKLTTDKTEAIFVAAYKVLKEKRVEPNGIVRYYQIYALPEEEKYKGRPVFILWREEAFDVGYPAWSNSIIKEQEEKKQDLSYWKRQIKITSTLMSRFKIHAEVCKKISDKEFKNSTSKDYWEWMKARMNERDRAFEYINTEDKGSVKFDFNEFTYHLVLCEQITQEMTSENVAYKIGDALNEYLDAGLLLADVHEGNIGHAHRPDDNDWADGIPLITDPGHVVSLTPELAQVTISRI
jgi:hypothetical protein